MAKKKRSKISDTLKNIDEYIKELSKQEDIVVRRGSDPRENVVIPTGIRMIDFMTGVGGVPTGILIHIMGPKSSGKTMLAYSIANSALKHPKIIENFKDLACCSIDLENSWNAPWFIKSIGIDPSQFLIVTSDSAQASLDVVDSNIRNGLIPVTIIDSVAAMLPDKERDSSMDQELIGQHARLLSKCCRKIMSPLTLRPLTTVIMVNQMRSQIGAVPLPDIPTGGTALRYYSSLEIKMRSKKLSSDDKYYSAGLADTAFAVSIEKSRLSARFKDKVLIYFNSQFGVHKGIDLLNTALAMGVVSQGGAYIKMDGNTLYQGRAQFAGLLQEYLSGAQISEEDTKVCKMLTDAVDARLQEERDAYEQSNYGKENTKLNTADTSSADI